MIDNPKNGITCCPECSSLQVMVIDSRDSNWGRRRRRKCNSCSHRWTTRECVETKTLDEEEIEKRLRKQILNEMLVALLVMKEQSHER